ncbi:AMP-binding protein [Sphingobium fuliginis]|uniref:AMP-binding protein n=1 Tax=Sphingobium fuliginis (strain ATCC 27551) TaxID=336203 RepID=UPI001304596E|nr:AMP-binding protein [Sphingobium fuliginis]
MAVISVSNLTRGAAHFRATGDWRDLQASTIIANELSADPDRIVVRDRDRMLTVRDLDLQSRRLAAWMRAQGVGAGDVVSFQLPNWIEVHVIDLAAALIGAISNPIVPIYRDAEVEFILRESNSKLYFAPTAFRSMRFDAMIDRISDRIPSLLRYVRVRDADGPCGFAHLLSGEHWLEAPVWVDPDTPRLLMYTSGTTGRPKGVLHSINTLSCEVENAARYWGLERGDIMLMPSPLTHITGYLYGVLFAELSGLTTILMDRWDASLAVEIIEDCSVNAMVAATPFLQELADAARARQTKLESLRLFACGGAPVAPEIMREATDAFAQCTALRVYGCTEAPTITLGAMVRGSATAICTEGFVVGHEVKLVDGDGNRIFGDAEGEILTRGPEVMLGYLRTEDNDAAFDSEGFFRTGDLGRFDAEGALTITGRSKDIIIRGGENIAPKEIEDLLHDHPAVAEAAVIGMPHERLGEAPCAFAVLQRGASTDAAQLQSYLDRAGLAKQKIPERFEFIDALPRTAAGKVQKFVLRDMFLIGEKNG